MDRVPLDAIPAIERDFAAAAAGEFDLGLRRPMPDATDFPAYVDTSDQRSRPARRGHSRVGRKFPRIVGAALPGTPPRRLEFRGLFGVPRDRPGCPGQRDGRPRESAGLVDSVHRGSPPVLRAADCGRHAAAGRVNASGVARPIRRGREQRAGRAVPVAWPETSARRFTAG